MKNLFFLVFSLLASSIGARTPTVPSSPITPILEFPSGRYLGLGHYITADNRRGTYSSYAEVKNDSWQVNYLREYGNEAYGVEFTFSDNGQFTVTLLSYINEELTDVFFGNGYCQSVQCHISANMGDRLFEETVTFLPQTKKIYRLGSISRIDMDFDNPELVMSWEETMIRVDQEDKGKKKRR